MRFAFVGASQLSVMTAALLIERGHKVVLIDVDKPRLDALADVLDCGFLHGDGTKPHILREVDPPHTDVLLCLTNHAQVNILAGVVGRSLGFARVITSIDDPEYEAICLELGLEDTIIPSRTISRYLADLVQGRDIPELSGVLRGEARFFVFTAGAEDAGMIKDLGLPGQARVICVYRDGQMVLAADKDRLHEADEVVVLTHSRNLPALRGRWQVKPAAS